MRKTLLIISMVAVMTGTAYAQKGDARFGIKLGPTFDWASSGSTAANNDGFRLGGTVGLVCDYYLMDNIAVSSGLNLNWLQLKYTFTDYRWVEDFLEKTEVPVSRRLKATNIEIPVKIKAGFDVFDSFKIYAEAGCGLSFNCKDYGKDTYSFYWVSSEGESYLDCTNQYRPLQFSMIFGLGAEYEINRSVSAFAQLTFDHSFSNAFVSPLEKQTGSIIRNNFVGVEVGILH